MYITLPKPEAEFVAKLIDRTDWTPADAMTFCVRLAIAVASDSQEGIERVWAVKEAAEVEARARIAAR